MFYIFRDAAHSPKNPTSITNLNLPVAPRSRLAIANLPGQSLTNHAGLTASAMQLPPDQTKRVTRPQ